MRKIFSVTLIFLLSLFVLGTSDILKAEATTDVTIYLHIHQYDGDYTNTGTGLWDGVNWNNWSDVVTTTDDFGGVVAKTFTAAEINAVMDSVEFKPTRNVLVDDAANYLAPNSVGGQVFADVTSLKDGSQTELHLYYVEGAKDFYEVKGTPSKGLVFVVYADPSVAANEEAYTGWNMWTWNNGTGGSADGVDFAADVELTSGDYAIDMKLGVLQVGDDADQDTGFIVRTEDWAKQCATDIMFDNTPVRGSGSLIYFYQAGSCELETDYAGWLESVGMKFEMNSGNRLIEGTEIVAPDQLDVTMLMSKLPENLIDRFMVKDAAGNIIPILSYDYKVSAALGQYTSDVELVTETHVVVFVDTLIDHAELGIVGNIQGWAPENAIMSLGDDMNGFAVFEFTTYEANAEFKILYDTDATAGLNWGDAELNSDNAVINLSAGGTIEVLFDDETDNIRAVNGMPIDVDIANYTYTSDVTCATGENLFTLFLDTDLDPASIGVVGSIQANDWTPAEAITYSDVTAEGYVVFETCLTDTKVEYKVLYTDPAEVDDPATTDVDESGFNWGDRELVLSNTVVDFGEGTTDGEIAHLINGPVTVLGDYETTLTAASTYRLSLYMTGDVDWTKVGVVGSVQSSEWDIANPIMYKEMDVFGNAIFDIAINAKTKEFIVVYDANDNGFDWDDKISGDDNIAVDLGEFATQVQYVMIDELMAMTFTNIGATISDITTATVSLMVAADTFMFGEDYTVEYVEELAPMSDLFFSEYGEPMGGNCKFIEIYNPTGAPVDLTNYKVARGANGKLWAEDGSEIDLTGTLAAGETLVVYRTECLSTDPLDDAQDPLASNPLFTVGTTGIWVPTTGTDFASWNGDDSIGLFKDGVLIDVIGKNGEDPGTDWPVGNGNTTDGITANSKLIRIPTVIIGEPDWAIGAMQWMVYADTDMTPDEARNYATVGVHTFEGEIGEVVISSGVLPFMLSNNFVEGNPVDMTGTYADSATTILVELENTSMMLDTLELIDSTGTVIAVDSYTYTNGGMGTYTPTVTCLEGEDKLTVYLHTNEAVTDLATVGLVGSVQGWAPENAVNPTGTDSNGNLVFEVCVATTTEGQAFKVLSEGEAASGFAWGDPELTPGDVLFTFDGDVSIYIEEGNAVAGSNLHTLTLTDATKLDVTKTYKLQFIDENGFVVYIDLDIDNEAPEITFTLKPNVPFELNQNATFNYMSFFDALGAIDNRDGELQLTVTSNVDTTTAGVKTFTVKAVDSWMNETSKSWEFTVKDTVKPVITVDAAKSYVAGTAEPTWADFATTNEGTITVNSSQADMLVPGTFFITYTATDAAGNSATANLEVTITAGEAVEKTGCFGTIGGAGSLFLALSFVLGASGLYFIRKK